MDFSLFDSLSIQCGINDDLVEKLVSACDILDVDIGGRKILAQCCLKGTIGKEEVMSLIEYAPGIIREAAKTRKLIWEKPMLWPDFIKELRLDFD